MDIEIVAPNEYGALSEDRVSEFERLIGHPLPASYRSFLLEYNGGCPKRCCITFPRSEKIWNIVNTVYGLHSGPRHARLDEALRAYSDFIPNTRLPFADEPGGNAYCIGITWQNYGRVYFWDHEANPGDDAVLLLADSFAEFLDSLVEEEE
jgi:hypothetical protein